MTTQFSRRAELALRVLPRADQDRVLAALKRAELAQGTSEDWLRRNVRRLHDPNYLLLRAGPRIRLILRRGDDVLYVEDIVDDDLLHRYPWASLRAAEAT